MWLYLENEMFEQFSKDPEIHSKLYSFFEEIGKVYSKAGNSLKWMLASEKKTKTFASNFIGVLNNRFTFSEKASISSPLFDTNLNSEWIDMIFTQMSPKDVAIQISLAEEVYFSYVRVKELLKYKDQNDENIKTVKLFVQR